MVEGGDGPAGRDIKCHLMNTGYQLYNQNTKLFIKHPVYILDPVYSAIPLCHHVSPRYSLGK